MPVHAADEILRFLQAREQAIASRRQSRLDDFGAGRIVVDQQDGQRLGHDGACIGLQPAGRNFHASTQGADSTRFPASQRPAVTLPSAAVTWP